MTSETDQNEPLTGPQPSEASPSPAATPSPRPAAAGGAGEVIVRERTIEKEAGRSPLWIIASMVIGFTLPVCACIALFFTGIAGLGSLDPTAGMGAQGDLGTGPAVAIVRVEGAIITTDDEDFINGAGSGTVIHDLRRAQENDDVRAIVLRVDSPGGTVTGSAQIHDFIRDEVTKPVVVSMFGVAASGGYYVSAPADYIFARPDTLTGSLGVIITLYDAQDLLDEIGLEVIDITSGPNKSIGNPWEELTPAQREIFEQIIEEGYDDFVRVIVEGRGLEEAAVREIADGRVYSGRQAQELGLVDELGDLREAIRKAADLGGISGEPRIIEYERLPSFQDFLVGFNSRLETSEADAVLQTVMDLTTPVIEYRYNGK